MIERGKQTQITPSGLGDKRTGGGTAWVISCSRICARWVERQAGLGSLSTSITCHMPSLGDNHRGSDILIACDFRLSGLRNDGHNSTAPT